MRMKYIILLLLSFFLLGGCGYNSKVKKEEPLTILTTSINYEKFIEAFHEIYPDIEIEFVSYRGYNQTGYIRECFEVGELPDIVTTTSFIDPNLQRERLLDLSKYSFVNNYTDSWLNRCNVDGSIYLLPSNYSAIGFYYNKTIIEKYGWELPNNFQELKELSVKIEEAGLTTCVARMDLDGFIFSDLFGLGNTFFFNTEEGAKWKEDFLCGKADAVGNLEPVLAYFNEWVEAGFISAEDINVNGVSDRFYAGEAVFMLCNGISVKEMDYEGIGKMEYGILPWLAPEGNSNMIVSNVSRYYGINKNLGQEGQEKRLKNALCLMEFISSEEGMKLLTTDTTTISPLNTWHIDENDIYFEIKEEIWGGNSIPLVYTGWDDLIIPIANELYALIRERHSVDECAKKIDHIRDKWLQHGPESLAYVEEDLSKEDAAYLVGKIFMEKNQADAALISLGGYRGYGKENAQGVQCGIYSGEMNLDRMRTLVPSGNMCVILMTGKEILKRKEEGIYLNNEKVEGELPFDYVLVTKNNMKLEEEREYVLVISHGELIEERRNEAIRSWSATDSEHMMEEYFSGLKEVVNKEFVYR